MATLNENTPIHEAEEMVCPIWSTPETDVCCQTTDCAFWDSGRTAEMKDYDEGDEQPEGDGWAVEEHPFEGKVWRRWVEAGKCQVVAQ